MKNSMWITGLLAVAFFQAGCSKSKGPSPDDTSLIKGTDRGTFIGSANDLANNGDDLSPLGATISGLDGDDGLFPQDPFWGDSAIPENPDRPFEERAKLQNIASFLQETPDARVLVEGYCDWKGTPSYNKSLGDRRASSVKDYLVDLGIEPSRVEVISIGDEIATPDADPTTAGLERKAQFIVLKDS